MKKLTADDPETRSADVLADNIEQLKALFPEAVTEGQIDFEILKQLLGDELDEKEENYGLHWHGKRRARQLALAPSTGTLRPCPEDSVCWETTRHVLIEGDNLEVLKLLQKSYSGKVKLIYIDPPYNTGHDFVYTDDFRNNIKNYLNLTGQIDGNGEKLSSNTDSSGRFHTDWLSMMYPRLRLARNLLRQDGAIFVSIDDTESGNLKGVLTEIFGEENFQADISWQKRYTRSNNTADFTTVIEHVLVFSKSESFCVNLLPRTPEADSRYSNPDNDSRGPWKGASFLNPATPQQRPNLCYPITNPHTGKVTKPTTNAWRRSKEEFLKLQDDGRLYWGSGGTQSVPTIKMFLSEARNITPINFWDHGYAGNTDQGTKEVRELLGEKVFDNPKPVQLVKRAIEHATRADSIILDFFAGSGTTGHAVLAKNAEDNGDRRYIMVQLPEPLDLTDKDQHLAANFCKSLDLPLNLAELTKERMRRAANKLKTENPLFAGDVGFRVFRLDSSNINEWEPEHDNLNRSLMNSVEHVKAERTEMDILYEILLKLGIDLCVPEERCSIAGKEVCAIGGGVLMACLVTTIARDETESLAQGIVEWRKALAPAGDTTCVFRDSAFEDDVVKTDLAAILEQNEMKNVRSL